MPDTARRRRGPWFLAGCAGIVVLVTVVLLGGGDDDALMPWHRWAPESELKAPAPEGFDFKQYLQLEARVFEELHSFVSNKVEFESGLGTSRYMPEGRNNPATFAENWNRSYVREVEDPVGSVLLLHGLTDSPYSLRSIAERLSESGMSIVGLRLPGHGTVPEALDRADRKDWRIAVQVAARYAAGLRPADSPLVIVGYSNGGALALEYALDALDDNDLPKPARLAMVSPAVGITRFAVLAGLPRALRFLPLPESSRWTDLVPEIDPYKYNSFPANAGYQTHKLTVSNRKRVAKLAAQGRSEELPPILAFVSLADSTVKMESVASDLMQPLANPANEMVVFDINRDAEVAALLAFDPAERLEWLAEQAPLAWTFTAISNKNAETREVVESRWIAGSEDAVVRELGMSWPKGLYSLSHVALQFPPDDPLYGQEWDSNQGWGLPLGSLELRGEKGLLQLDMSSIMRLRHNPFYPYLEGRIVEFLGCSAEEGPAVP